MKRALLTSTSDDKMALLLKLAEELGITVKQLPAKANGVEIPYAAISESSLAEEWLSEEDNRWDEFYSK
ncbi:MAG: hypothetical protein KBF73_10130 [Flavobacteriales bacterium]|nr:hypothetical protein [Flavobacteriales bacterium]